MVFAKYSGNLRHLQLVRTQPQLNMADKSDEIPNAKFRRPNTPPSINSLHRCLDGYSANYHSV